MRRIKGGIYGEKEGGTIAIKEFHVPGVVSPIKINQKILIALLRQIFHL